MVLLTISSLAAVSFVYNVMQSGTPFTAAAYVNLTLLEYHTLFKSDVYTTLISLHNLAY